MVLRKKVNLCVCVCCLWRVQSETEQFGLSLAIVVVAVVASFEQMIYTHQHIHFAQVSFRCASCLHSARSIVRTAQLARGGPAKRDQLQLPFGFKRGSGAGAGSGFWRIHIRIYKSAFER